MSSTQDTQKEVSGAPRPADPIGADHPRRSLYVRWLRELTSLPTATGREGRVVGWVRDWLDERPDLAWRSDAYGNIEVRFADVPGNGADGGSRPIHFTAHLDHPAFVVRCVVAPGEVELEFRGGVMADYFIDARVVAHPDTSEPIGGSLTGKVEETEGEKHLFPRYTCVLDEARALSPGDIVVWELPEAEIIDDEFGGIIYTHACDDLAALAAALAALEELRLTRAERTETGDVRVLMTRAEEIGFIGAIGACKSGIIPEGSRLIALENSRSFPDSPIHGGPIVRVGDRTSVFSPELTAAVADVARKICGHDATPKASEKASEWTWRWQRKLMAGGSCEASVYCAFGLTATCVCLPLGNYHNMADLTAVQAGTNESPARVGREHVGIDDYFGMVDLLVGCGRDLGDKPAFAQRLEKLWEERRFVVEDG